MHGISDRVVAIVGFDLTMKFFHKLVIDQMPACRRHVRYLTGLLDLQLLI